MMRNKINLKLFKYDSDSYEFAKGKPLTLLNDANLLYLLEKHGTRARIDIKEARRLIIAL